MKEFFKNIKWVWKYAKGEKIKLIVFSIFTIVTMICSIVIPIYDAKEIVSLTSNKLEQFIFICFIIFIFYGIENIAYYIRRMLNEKIIYKMYNNIQTDLGREILKLNNKTLEENGSGSFIQRLTGDTRNISKIFTDINGYITGIISNFGVLIAYFFISKPIFLAVFIAFILRLIYDTKRINVYIKNDKKYNKMVDTITGFAGEIVRGAEDIKMLNGEESFIKELNKRFDNLNSEKYLMEKENNNYLIFRQYLTNAFDFVLMCLIAREVTIGAITIPSAVVVLNFSGRYKSLVTNITSFQELIKKFNLSANRILEIFDSDKYQKEQFGNIHLDKVNGDFEFKNVSFKYDKNEVLKDLSFKVNANETVAFVGKSGAGKTTIFNLLCKMYDNYSGLITIDGIDINKLDKSSIRGNITIVSQNPYIFNMSIKENLKIVKEDLTDKEMKEALKMACLDDFVESLPNKYDTVVGESGVILSGGQKQRLAIARAFVQKTEIILFDEATSALDNETQMKIQQAITNLQKDYTILIIAHRLSTIKNADRILMLDNGNIIAEGTHKELLKNCVEYKNLYESEISKNRS